MECLAPSTLRKGPVIIYVEGGGGGVREIHVGKIKISVRPPLQTI